MEIGWGVYSLVQQSLCHLDRLALDHKSIDSWGGIIGRGGVALSGTAIFVLSWLSCFRS